VAWRVERTIAGRKMALESGDVARQADGAVLVSFGETVVLVAAVAEPAEQDLGFFPLTVDYREKQYAAGKFPGGIIKREGRPTTKEILTMRLIDRPVRPLFPEDYLEEVLVSACVLSADKENDPDLLSLIGASAALALSDIPFHGPIAGTRVGLVRDEFVMNPTIAQREESELELVVAGTAQAVTMVEGSARVIPEEDVLTAISLAQDVNVEVVSMIRELVEQCGKPKRTYAPLPPVEPVLERLRPLFGERVAEASRTPGKLARQEALDALKKEAIEELCGGEEAEFPDQRQVAKAFERLEAEVVRRQILQDGVRCDGRKPHELRPITCRVGVLPRTHGSALFTRGETQVLAVTTLGTVADEQKVLDPLVEEEPKKFMVHYNFPGWCVGEVWRPSGPKRREIGHGELAERALRAVLPPEDAFPYTIRLVADVLESNGSSSMASVCGGTLSMMDAGIPISDPVAGIAMGVVAEGGRHVVLTDIAGVEDHYGDMDFKVAGTQHGLTALQLDVKTHGVGQEVLREVLERAREARLQILRAMLVTIREPRDHLSPYAPVLKRVKIDPEHIGMLIGPGGRTIKGLESRFDCDIEVEDDGTVTVSGDSTADVAGAVRYIENLGGAGVEVGKVYEGRVAEIRDFGAIVELFPGADGLCHISELDEGYVKRVEDICKVGDRMRVKVLSVDGDRVRLSRKAALKESSQPAHRGAPQGKGGRGGRR